MPFGEVGRRRVGHQLEHRMAGAQHRHEMPGGFADQIADMAQAVQRISREQAQGAGEIQRQRLGTELLHQQARQQGPADRTEAVDQQQTAGAGENFIAVQLVDQLRHGNRVDGEGQTAPDEDQSEQQGAARQHGDQQRHYHRQRHDPEQHQAAVVFVGINADRPLQQGAAENCAAHQQADAGGIEAAQAGVYRRHRPERAQRQAGQARGGNRHGRDADDLAQVGVHHVRHAGLDLPGQGDRHQRCADQDRGKREQ